MIEADATATIDGRTSRFLDVEETARTLVARLQRLDEEASRYEGAARSLDATASATSELVDVVREVAANAAKAIEVVASVGGPEILTRLSLLESLRTEQSAALMKKVGLATSLAGLAALLAFAALVVQLLK